MEPSRPTRPASTAAQAWRYAILTVLVGGSLAWILSREPIAQDVRYHAFADTRTILGIPNCLDVVSNLPFLVIGMLGVRFCLHKDAGAGRIAWAVLFAGVALVSAGSAYYHLSPSNASLLWDRLPMTIGFMGLFIALLGEHIDPRLVARLLVPAVLLGLASVVYWRWTNDLRPYVWIQFAPLLTIPVVVIVFRSDYSHQWLLLVALGCYVLAKVAESYDLVIFRNTQGFVSGHTLKHLLAAASCYSILLMLQIRTSGKAREQQ